jgi:hypothetical protein
MRASRPTGRGRARGGGARARVRRPASPGGGVRGGDDVFVLIDRSRSDGAAADSLGHDAASLSRSARRHHGRSTLAVADTLRVEGYPLASTHIPPLSMTFRRAGFDVRALGRGSQQCGRRRGRSRTSAGRVRDQHGPRRHAAVEPDRATRTGDRRESGLRPGIEAANAASARGTGSTGRGLPRRRADLVFGWW